MKQQFIKDAAGTFKLYVYENNRKVVPSAAVITVYKPGSSEKLVDAQAMSVAGDGLLSYALTTTHNAVLGEDYKAVVKYTVSGADYYQPLFYDVVNSKLGTVITDDDIVNELPQLRNAGWRVLGTVVSGSTTTIVDSALKKYDDDYFTGGLARNLTSGEDRNITDFVSSSGTVTTEAFDTAAAAGNKYCLYRSFGKEIQRAFEKMEKRLKDKGKRPQLVLDSYDLREPHILFSVAEVCKGMARDGADSFWWELWKDYAKQAEDSFNAVSLKYDSSGDGIISGDEANKHMKTIKVRF